MRSVNFIEGQPILSHSENEKVKQNFHCLQTKYCKNEIHQSLHQSSSTFPQKAKDTDKICILNQYIREEYTYFLLNFLNKKKPIFFF